MSWHFSRALVVAFWEDGCSAGKPCAPSNSINTPDKCSSPDRTKDALIHSQFGMTCEPSTGDHGEALLMWFREVFRVRTSAPQERELESPGSAAGSGARWLGSLAKYDPASRSWKTHQCSLLGGLEPFSETFPKWGSMRNGEFLERTMWEPHTAESEFGFWPTTRQSSDKIPRTKFATPTARDWKDTPGMALTGTNPDGSERSRLDRLAAQVYSEQEEIGGLLNPNWVEWLMGWPIGWTDCDASGTDRFRQWCDSHGMSLEKGFDV